MAILPRKYQKVFASAASNIGQIGSGQTGAKLLTSDLDVIQALAAFDNGLSDVTLSAKKLPPIEEFNALFYDATFQLVYLFQEGIPEYDISTEYRINSLIKESGTTNIWKSLVNTNTGNPLVAGVNWSKLGDLTTLQLLAANTILTDLSTLSPTPSVSTVPYFTGSGNVSALKTIGVASGNLPVVGTSSATESLAGLAEIATQAETDAGTNDVTIVTPKKLRWGFATLLAQNGYIVFPTWMGSLMIQWGFRTVINGTLTFPIAFSSACWSIAVSGGSNNSNVAYSDSLTAANFDAYGFFPGIGRGNAVNYKYIAIGV